jgi:hypothetical protein
VRRRDVTVTGTVLQPVRHDARPLSLLLGTARASGEISEQGWIGERPVEPVPPHVSDVGAVLLRDAVPMSHSLESQVHQLTTIRKVMQHIGDVDVPLVIEVGQRPGEKAIDDIAVLALHAERFDRALQLAACTERWRELDRAQDAPPVSISVAKWSGRPSAARIAAAMLAMS